MSGVALRPACVSDEPFLLGVYASTRADELAAVPWNDEQRAAFVAQQFEAQSAHYAQHYSEMTKDVIEVNGRPAGRLLVARWSEEIRIVDIALLPAFRGSGVGTALIEDLRSEAAASGKSLSIHVEKFNPARRLYERLGFVIEEDKGVYLLMRWSG